MESRLKTRLDEIYHYYHYLTFLRTRNALCYPHPIYGDFLKKEEIRKTWDNTANLIKKGKAPKKISLYFHIPFCKCHCLYCMSGTIKDKNPKIFMDNYLKLIYEEIEFLSPQIKNLDISTVYFGGGTPSLLNEKQLTELINKIKENFKIIKKTRIIFEASPFTLTKEYIDTLEKLEIYELDIGIQSLDQEVLNKNHRPQNIDQAINIIKYAKKSKIPSISVDIMVGLPHQNKESAVNTIKEIISLDVDGIFINEFLPLEFTKFSLEGGTCSEKYNLKKKEASKEVKNLLKSKGYVLTPGGYRKKWTKEDNQLVYETQEDENIMGFGYGSYSHAYGSYKYEMIYPVEDFMELIGMPKNQTRCKGIYDYSFSKLLSKKYSQSKIKKTEKKPPFIYLGIKTDLSKEMYIFAYTHFDCINFKEFKSKFGKEVKEVFKSQLKILKALKLIKISDSKIIILPKDRVIREVIRTFFMQKEYLLQIEQSNNDLYDKNKDYLKLVNISIN